MKKQKIAVVGATSSVGQEILRTLAEQDFPVLEAFALDNAEAAQSEVSFGEDDILSVQDVERFDFKGVDLCFMATDPETAKKIAPRAAAAGCTVIDNSSVFSMDPDVPLVVPEVNPEALADCKKRHIVASPCGLAIQLAMVLKPLHDIAKATRVVVSTYQSVSSVGHAAMDELFTQTRAIFVNDQLVHEQFHKQIAFNVIPHIGEFMEDGDTKEEWRLMIETKKIIDPKIKLTATCVRVPVFIGHALSINVDFQNPIDANEARAALKKAKGVTVIDHQHEDGFITPVECTGEDEVFVSRIREDMTLENGLNLWVVNDNLRKGAALNMVQIAQALLKGR